MLNKYITVYTSILRGLIHVAHDAQIATYAKIIEQFQAAYPDWDGKVLSPEESVAAMLETVSKLTAKDSGAFISHHGNKEDWL